MTQISATLSISYPSRGDDKKGVSIRIEDKASGIEFVNLFVSHEQFSAALSGLQCRPAIECEVRGLDLVGKTRESENFKMYFEGNVPSKWDKKTGGEEGAARALNEEAERQGFATDGWTTSAYFALNAQGGSGKDEKGKWYRMSRVRFHTVLD